MHYFYAETNRSLPPLRFENKKNGKRGKPEKYFSPWLTDKLIRLWQDLEPDEIDTFFIDTTPIIDFYSRFKSFKTIVQSLKEEAAKPEDCESIWLMFSKRIKTLEITQSIAIRKFLVHDQKNLFIRCCARILPPDCCFEPKKITEELQQGFKLLKRWLVKISKHEVFKEWGVLPKFQTWQEVTVPPELIIKNGQVGKQLPLPGDEIKNPEHLYSLQFVWLLVNCRNPKTRITADGKTLYLPYYSRFMAKALENNPVPGITMPLIKQLLPEKYGKK